MSAKLKEYNGYRDMTDDEVVDLAQAGNKMAIEYLIKKYKNFVKARSRSYFLIGADNDDIVQEGMIGLYKAIKDYKKEELASFFSFAELCITRQIITAIKTATRQKHQPLNSCVSLDKPMFNSDSSRCLLDVLEGSNLDNPERLVVSDEIYGMLETNIQDMLSELELQVLQEYLQGNSYQKIANNLGRHVKSVDNALQRVKRKLEELLEEKNI